jgi:hypothetical protein
MAKRGAHRIAVDAARLDLSTPASLDGVIAMPITTSPAGRAGRPQRPLSGMAMSVLLRRMNVDATVHGMRSSARSWMADQGVPFDLAEACLAHGRQRRRAGLPA